MAVVGAHRWPCSSIVIRMSDGDTFLGFVEEESHDIVGRHRADGRNIKESNNRWPWRKSTPGPAGLVVGAQARENGRSAEMPTLCSTPTTPSSSSSAVG